MILIMMINMIDDLMNRRMVIVILIYAYQFYLSLIIMYLSIHPISLYDE